jgi:chromosome segregation ATPase
METATQTTALATIDIEKVQDIIASAPMVLEQNRTSRENGLKRYKTLKELVSEHGMSDELDKQLASFIPKAKATIQAMNERRKPFTQTVDALKKEFTSIENELKTAADDLQSDRNAYASIKMEEQRERERQAQRKLQIEKEKIRVESELKTKLSENYSDFLNRQKNQLLDVFENATLEDYDQVAEQISQFRPVFNKETFEALTPSVSFDSLLITQADVDQITTAIMDETMLMTIEADYRKNILAFRKDLLDKLPTKKDELEELAKAGKAEQERLQAEAKKRREEEQARMYAEAEAAKQKAREEASTKAAADLFEASVSTQADMGFNEAPKVKEAVEIIIKRPAGYALIFQFWFEKEGSKLPADKIERMTIARMMAFCEKHTLATGEVISSPLIEYKEIFKAK